MPMQVSYGHISRADAIRESAIALLQDELSEVFDNSTPSNPRITVHAQTQSDKATGTSYFEHLLALSIFIGLGYALFEAVTR